MDQDIVQSGYETQAFGPTNYAGEWAAKWCKGGHFHAGIDIGCGCGRPVRTTRSGVIVAMPVPGGDQRYPYYLGDQSVGQETDDGVYMEFGHLSKSYVVKGDRVKAGQVIGLSGTKGASTGCHVHLEIRTDGAVQGVWYAKPDNRILDPTSWLHMEASKPQLQPVTPVAPLPLMEENVMFTVVANKDGLLEVFMISSTGALRHCYQHNKPGDNGVDWSGWEPLGPITDYVGEPVVALNSDGRLEVFATRKDGSVDHLYQSEPGVGPWDGPLTLGKP